MNLAQLKQQIKELEEKNGPEILELEIYTPESHDYWGTLLNPTDGIDVVENGPVDGPKKPLKKCLVLA